MTETERAREPAVASAVAKAVRRLVPFLLLMYVLAFLDRVNIGFAQESFQADTRLGDAAYAFGAGVFFLGYVLLEVPSNLLLRRFGARRWMARIMISWGLVSAALMFAHTAEVFYGLRFLLGVAEAGFFPGVIYFLTLWVPAAHRARVMSLFYFGAPLAFIFGSPLSGLLLEMDGISGLHGWQWLFLVQGLATVVVGVIALRVLPDSPASAPWLTPREKAALTAAVGAEDGAKEESSVLRALRSGRVLYLSLIYFVIQVSVYGVTFFLPTQVGELLGSTVGFEVSLVTAVPWVCAIAGSVVAGRVSDRTGRRLPVAACCLIAGAAGISGSAAAGSPLLALAALCVAAAGFIAVQPVFWTQPTAFLTGAAAAGGIALVNSLGSIGGFVAPNVKTWADGVAGSPTAGLHVIAGFTLFGAVLIAGLGAWRRTRPQGAAGRPGEFPVQELPVQTEEESRVN
ncbi:MFS transporter [Streptomyces abyssalis]|uniref:MFS transporter n=1 Tax=Streptomyces abyssalis TaxID=933944 RepID=UPI00085C6E4E|nr:MFS transporter [Streptomyces abyssalis]